MDPVYGRGSRGVNAPPGADQRATVRFPECKRGAEAKRRMDRNQRTFVRHIAFEPPREEPALSNLFRWKLLCAALTATTALAAVKAWRHGDAAAAPAASTARGDDVAIRRPIHIAASAVGLSEHALLDQIRSARSPQQVALLCERLAMVGTDDAVDALAPMVDDRRPGVPEAV